MFCPYCGNEIKNTNTKFCGKCGKALNVQKPQAPAPQTTSAQPAVNSNTPVAAPAATPVREAHIPVTPMRTQATPALRPQKAREMSASPLISKQSLITASLQFSLALLYAGISFLLIFMLFIPDSITLQSLSGEGDEGTLMLSELLSIMTKGNDIFNPTAVTSAMGIGAHILIFSIPAFALISLIGSIAKKKAGAFYVTFTIMSILSAIYIALIAPLANILTPDLKKAAALDASVIIADAGNFISVKLIVFASISAVLSIGSAVLGAAIGKRRNKK